ncbi:MAG TPA: hypothetical protein GX504_07830 [Clostridia bacterium]|nr:hypothetical protein [Clostridia bacterium]
MPENQTKSFWPWLGGKQKYSTGFLLAALCLGLMLFALSYATRPPESQQAPVSPETVFGETEISRTEKTLEERLEQILSQIAGAGTVDVSVFLATGTRYEYAISVSANKRVIDEKDQNGGVRLTTEENSSDEYVLIRGHQAEEKPVVIQESRPQVQGVLVVADGARDARVRAQLMQAVQVALGVEPHRIQVLAREVR